jgi:hypothetical protein
LLGRNCQPDEEQLPVAVGRVGRVRARVEPRDPVIDVTLGPARRLAPQDVGIGHVERIVGRS